MFYGTGTRLEKALTPNIPGVRDLEDTIIVSTSDGYEYFFPCNFFFDVNFLTYFYSTKRRSKRIKIMPKKI